MYTKADFVSRLIVGAIALVQVDVAAAYSPNDIIANYAGNGTQGYGGDGAAAVSAVLNIPADLAVDSAGNLYISDAGNGTIRKIATSGIITTIAGTGVPGYNGDNIPAATAQLYPRGIAFDAAGDLYIADTGNARIRKITFSTGLISTVAGNGTDGCSNDTAANAVLSGPGSLAFDSAGTLYFSELGNRIVRKLSGGFVSSFAGTCTQSVFEFPDGLMTDSSGNVYVADGGTHPYVWKYDSGGNRSVFAGNGANGNTGDGSAANSAGVTLSAPEGLAHDAAGNIFIGSGSVVRVVTSDGIIHTAAGNGAGGYTGDGGLATAAELGDTGGLATNAAGRLFVADISLSPRVRIVGPPAPLVVTVAGDGIAATGDGVGSADGRINCPGTCGANYVSGMPVILDATQASTDALYEWGNGACRGNTACTVNPQTIVPTDITARFSPWYIRTLLGGTVGPALQSPFGLAFDTSGTLYFTETAACVVRKRSSGGALTTIAGNGVCGNLGDGIPATHAELNNPQGVVVDAAGNVYIQDTGNGVIRKVSGDGVLHTYAGGIYNGSNSPALAIDSSGNLFALGSATTIVRITPDGSAHPFVTVTSGEAQALDGLASGTDDGLVAYGTFRDFGTQLVPTVLFISKQGAIPSGYYTSDVPEVPSGLAEDRRGDAYSEYYNCSTTFAFVTPTIVNSYLVTAAACGYGGDGGPAISATLNGPVGLAFGSNGWLYVADTGNNAIRVLYPDAIFTHGFEQ